MSIEFQSVTAETKADDIPALEAGDHLTLDEFLRRYEAMPDAEHVELVEGVVHITTSVSAADHGEPHFDLVTWLGYYEAYTLGVKGGDNSTLLLDVDNGPQPDAYLRLTPERGGKSRVVDKYLQGPPELIAEVAASTASYDLHEKLNAYRRNGVQEYVVWRVRDREVDWFVLRRGKYERLPADSDGVYKSEVFSGLWLDAPAVITDDMPKVLAVLQAGIESAANHEKRGMKTV